MKIIIIVLLFLGFSSLFTQEGENLFELAKKIDYFKNEIDSLKDYCSSDNCCNYAGNLKDDCEKTFKFINNELINNLNKDDFKITTKQIDKILVNIRENIYINVYNIAENLCEKDENKTDNFCVYLNKLKEKRKKFRDINIEDFHKKLEESKNEFQTAKNKLLDINSIGSSCTNNEQPNQLNFPEIKTDNAITDKSFQTEFNAITEFCNNHSSCDKCTNINHDNLKELLENYIKNNERFNRLKNNYDDIFEKIISELKNFPDECEKYFNKTDCESKDSINANLDSIINLKNIKIIIETKYNIIMHNDSSSREICKIIENGSDCKNIYESKLIKSIEENNKYSLFNSEIKLYLDMCYQTNLSEDCIKNLNAKKDIFLSTKDISKKEDFFKDVKELIYIFLSQNPIQNQYIESKTEFKQETTNSTNNINDKSLQSIVVDSVIDKIEYDVFNLIIEKFKNKVFNTKLSNNIRIKDIFPKLYDYLIMSKIENTLLKKTFQSIIKEDLKNLLVNMSIKLIPDDKKGNYSFIIFQTLMKTLDKLNKDENVFTVIDSLLYEYKLNNYVSSELNSNLMDYRTNFYFKFYASMNLINNIYKNIEHNLNNEIIFEDLKKTTILKYYISLLIQRNKEDLKTLGFFDESDLYVNDLKEDLKNNLMKKIVYYNKNFFEIMGIELKDDEFIFNNQILKTIDKIIPLSSFGFEAFYKDYAKINQELFNQLGFANELKNLNMNISECYTNDSGVMNLKKIGISEIMKSNKSNECFYKVNLSVILKKITELKSDKFKDINKYLSLKPTFNNLKEIISDLSKNAKIGENLKGEFKNIGIKFTDKGMDFIPEVIIQKKVEQLSNIVIDLHYIYKKIKKSESTKHSFGDICKLLKNIFEISYRIIKINIPSDRQHIEKLISLILNNYTLAEEQKYNEFVINITDILNILNTENKLSSDFNDFIYLLSDIATAKNSEEIKNILKEYFIESGNTKESKKTGFFLNTYLGIGTGFDFNKDKKTNDIKNSFVMNLYTPIGIEYKYYKYSFFASLFDISGAVKNRYDVGDDFSSDGFTQFISPGLFVNYSISYPISLGIGVNYSFEKKITSIGINLSIDVPLLNFNNFF